jgi:hypothetical protein
MYLEFELIFFCLFKIFVFVYFLDYIEKNILFFWNTKKHYKNERIKYNLIYLIE